MRGDGRIELAVTGGACDTLPDLVQVVSRTEIRLRDHGPKGTCTAQGVHYTYLIHLGDRVSTDDPITVHLDRVAGERATIVALPR